MKTLPATGLIIASAVRLCWGQTNQFFITYEARTLFYETNIVPEQVEWARHAKESRPAEDDPEGNWGQPVEGFRLSIRLEKGTFTVSEPVKARILLRNVTDHSLTYMVSSTKDPEDSLVLLRGNDRIPRKDEPGPNASLADKMTAIRSGSLYDCQIPSGTQREFLVDLSRVFDLTTNTEYTVSARRRIVNSTHTAFTNVSSGNAAFSIVSSRTGKRR